jgi:hypothetical protein
VWRKRILRRRGILRRRLWGKEDVVENDAKEIVQVVDLEDEGYFKE